MTSSDCYHYIAWISCSYLSGLTHLFILYWTFPQYVSICSWTCIYLTMAQSDLAVLPPRIVWIFVLSVSAMLIVFLMYVNKSVHMYIYIYIYIYIYMHPHTHKCGHVCICMEKKVSWYCILLYMIMNMFTIKISKVIWQVYDDRKGKYMPLGVTLIL